MLTIPPRERAYSNSHANTQPHTWGQIKRKNTTCSRRVVNVFGGRQGCQRLCRGMRRAGGGLSAQTAERHAIAYGLIHFWARPSGSHASCVRARSMNMRCVASSERAHAEIMKMENRRTSVRRLTHFLQNCRCGTATMERPQLFFRPHYFVLQIPII